MWNDVVIGNGPWGTMATLVRKLDIETHQTDISQNHVSYWVHGASYLNIGMRIAKDTDEGKTLTQLLESKAADEKIVEFIEGVAVKNIEPKVLKNKFHAAVNRAFQDGQEHQAALMRRALLI